MRPTSPGQVLVVGRVGRIGWHGWPFTVHSTGATRWATVGVAPSAYHVDIFQPNCQAGFPALPRAR